MVSELLTPDEIERIEQDKKFYQFQEKLQKAKLAAGIPLVQFDYDSRFNMIKRVDWLKKIESNVQARLNMSYEKQTLITSNTPDFEDAKKLIYKEENTRKDLHIFLAKIKEKISSIVSSRKGLPLLAIQWKNHAAKIARYDYDLYFLSPTYQNHFAFIRPEFDEQDFEIIQEIYNSFLSPTDLINAFSKFLGIDATKIVVACSNQRFNGIEIWVSNEAKIYESFKNNKCIEYIDFDNSFVLKYDNSFIDCFVESDTFKNIDVWIDPLSLEIFVKRTTMPLNINRVLDFPELLNIEYIPLVAFDYSLKVHLIDIPSIIKQINDILPTVIIRDIFAYDGKDFELIPCTQDTIWTFANLVLFSLSNDSANGRFIFVYNVEKRTLSKFEYRQSFSFDDLIKLVSETLEYLRISGFELYSPDKLIEKYDNQGRRNADGTAIRLT
ncbi:MULTISPECIES: hypothetical protein [Acinetobacter]|uniref:Uncharacterized protein n=1 Tax=Acinetobacter indicus TaxID=756892 RepID=A0A6C0Y6Q1_9GAMM|nr:MULTISPECIES: hypothetical protein [Acinetobacter]QIC71780.1 hypothetical protein FSC09_15420 [Acinetobacter indicus]QKQ71688.1 hypothetical protein E5Y90_15780 [Acinetobacter sp. 10FS3-1]